MRSAALALLASLAASSSLSARAASAADAQAFVKSADQDLRRLLVRQNYAEWVKSTYITDDTEQLAAWANEDLMAYLSRAIPEAMRLEALPDLDPETRRMLKLLRLESPLPAPDDPGKRAELASVAAKLEGLYGKGKWCGADGKGRCRDLLELQEVLRTSRSWDELTAAWAGWHSVARPMKPLYERLVALADEGAREIGFRDLGEFWRSGYEMTPAEFEAETDRLWEQVRPLYVDLHCYVRARLARRYGESRVPPAGPIPAQLLGNMWAQEWNNIYALVEPYPNAAPLEVDGAL
jgi:peptidyl-dipeptidase A